MNTNGKIVAGLAVIAVMMMGLSWWLGHLPNWIDPNYVDVESPSPRLPIRFLDISTEYDLNITVTNDNVTHYNVGVGSDIIYLGVTYYDVKSIPENRAITVHRGAIHQVMIYYWVTQDNGLYKLVEMGVYQ